MTARAVRGLVTVGVVLMLVATACGSSKKAVSSNTTVGSATTTGGATTTTVAGLAAGDEPTTLSGSLNWQTDWTIEQAQAYIKAFNKVYPNIVVNYTRSDDAEFVDKFNVEAKTGHVSEDLITVGYDGFFKDWDKSGYLLHYQSPEGAVFPASFQGTAGAYYVNAQLVTGICYNTDVLSSKNVAPPTSWEDLTDPKYKGLMVMQDILKQGSGAQALMINLRGFWTGDNPTANVAADAMWSTYFANLGKQKVTFQPSYTEAQQQLVQGNAAVMPVCYPDYIQPDIAKGAPVKWIAAPPVIEVFFGQGITAKAAHPDQAKAFQDYSLSAPGQQALVGIVGQVPTRPGIPYPAIAKGAQGVKAYPALDTPWSANEYTCCAAQYTAKAKAWFGLQ